jgi:hypothetical protein
MERMDWATRQVPAFRRRVIEPPIRLTRPVILPVLGLVDVVGVPSAG